MKKNNQKGFMLTETLVVSTLIITVLLFLFVQFRNINQSYQKTFTYNSADALYAAENLKNFYATDNYDAMVESYRNSGLKYIDLTNCPTPMVLDQEYCLTLTSKVNVKTVLLTDADMTYIIQALDRKILTVTPSMEQFIRSIKNDEKDTLLKYRLIVELNSNEFATIKIG